mmetsp:Transcript_110985/g.312917  ORF Transcript_110985/g.312917 Transcript_110985/m.312917 type:complete len:83 (-) Transcript_110985:696-944(-)
MIERRVYVPLELATFMGRVVAVTLALNRRAALLIKAPLLSSSMQAKAVGWVQGPSPKRASLRILVAVPAVMGPLALTCPQGH